jgi:PLP dependent protein
MEEASGTISGSVEILRERIDRAAERGGRRSGEITLVGISKGVPAERIREAFHAGIKHFGESKVQEWEAKAPLLEDISAQWHLVGHLQRNKAARAISLFHTVDSVDSLPLAEKLQHAAGEGRRLPVLIEVRLDLESPKTGCAPEEVPRLAEGILLMPRLDLRGLMTVPAFSANPEDVRPTFRRLRELRDELVRLLDWSLDELSMGMSNDFEIAIEEGATQIRVGSALFGSRAGIK